MQEPGQFGDVVAEHGEVGDPAGVGGPAADVRQAYRGQDQHRGDRDDQQAGELGADARVPEPGERTTSHSQGRGSRAHDISFADAGAMPFEVCGPAPSDARSKVRAECGTAAISSEPRAVWEAWNLPETDRLSE
ncbi:hypothetical protein GCM10010168_11460 [Actinoplanes ianthinogenes]|uniref:Uncharacterized protein n=1 Tax=Actinoplanes ianthinogenes TaxID=122358 RepID=A0ABM7LYE3_9ACTN|nr:hypothetical protein Aiant_49900 [Actinoplanes ianthinogenes]GGQ97340.1 hypothetical protein GCM10010168_11460 [Actinoplanes ianthinogenes]